MSSVSLFLKENKVQKENTTYAATKSLLDENGDPVLWTIRPLSTKEYNALRSESMIEVPVKGKKGVYRPTLDTNKLSEKMVCASVVDPPLANAELQDSYGVVKPEDLLNELIDTPAEYDELAKFVQEFNGYTVSFEEEVDEVKND